MRLGMTEKTDWRYVGAVLAKSDDEDQAAFFQGFLAECRSWGTSYQVEQQFAAVNAKLNQSEREALKMLSYTEGE